MIDPRLQRIKTAAVVAKNTQKAGPTEVWNSKELEFLVEIGKVVRGSWKEYVQNPCFITAKETTSPLTLTTPAGEVLLALARKGLPCTIIPMPISGGTCPVTLASNIVMANAEILGAMAAIKAVYPEAPVVGGVISGIMDMSTGGTSFAAPEAILQDLGLAKLHEELYGFDLGIGTGYIDAKCPGIQAGVEKELKILTSGLVGRVNYPVGILNGGKRFSPEEALIDIEIAKLVHQYLKGIEVNEDTLAIEAIQEVGIGGNFLSHDHTLGNFRKVIWFPEIFERSLFEKEDVMNKARQRWKSVLESSQPYRIEREKAKEIDRIVKSAEEYL